MAVQLPACEGRARRVSRGVFVKQVLPKGSIEYQGRTLRFDRAYLDLVAANFRARAVDQVPFVLANERNQHNEDPARFRGEVKQLVVGNNGLYAVIETTAAGTRVLEENPRLGASVRLRESGAVLEHVLGTLDPHVRGMRPWRTVDLAASAEVLDLSRSTWRPPGDLTERQEARRLAQLWRT